MDIRTQNEMVSSPTRDCALIDIVESSHAANANDHGDSQRRMQRCIHKVPQHWLREESRDIFEPEVISLGLYHFNKPAFSHIEVLKAEVLKMFVMKSMASDPAKNKALFLKEIMERMTEIRSYYASAVLNCFDDGILASAILNDTSFMISWMENAFKVKAKIQNHLGYSTVVFLTRDLIKLENQIPFWLIKRVMDLRFGKDEADELVRKELSYFCFVNEDILTKLPWGNAEEQQPLHLLEAYRTIFLKGEVITKAKSGMVSRFLTQVTRGKVWKAGNIIRFRENNLINTLNSPFRSVTYLQAKGIYFQPSSHSLRDITFTSNPFYGVLQLPILFIDRNTKVVFSNLVAFEMSPRNIIDDRSITYYVNFMKSLIESEKDVKELRERGILLTRLGTDEEIVKAFKGIITHGYSSFGIFENVKIGIDEHCNSKAKTWISDLVHTYFRSPWTTIALFAGMLILCLTFLQTYFTINPVSRS